MTHSPSMNEMKDYIHSFKKKQKYDSYNETFTVVGKDTYISDLHDKDFYIQSLTCILCRKKFLSFMGVFFHSILVHENFEFFYDASRNNDGLIEAHIFAIYKNTFELEEDLEVDFCLKVYKSEVYKQVNNKILKYKIQPTPIDQEKNSQKTKPKEKKFKMYPRDENERIFFHSVTGQLLHEDSEDSDYSIDDEDLREYEEKDIDNFLDVCESDKIFMKLWNRFIKTQT